MCSHASEQKLCVSADRDALFVVKRRTSTEGLRRLSVLSKTRRRLQTPLREGGDLRAKNLFFCLFFSPAHVLQGKSGGKRAKRILLVMRNSCFVLVFS